MHQNLTACAQVWAELARVRARSAAELDNADMLAEVALGLRLATAMEQSHMAAAMHAM